MQADLYISGFCIDKFNCPGDRKRDVGYFLMYKYNKYLYIYITVDKSYLEDYIYTGLYMDYMQSIISLYIRNQNF